MGVTGLPRSIQVIIDVVGAGHTGVNAHLVYASVSINKPVFKPFPAPLHGSS
jgi:hypothetical protein